MLPSSPSEAKLERMGKRGLQGLGAPSASFLRRPRRPVLSAMVQSTAGSAHALSAYPDLPSASAHGKNGVLNDGSPRGAIPVRRAFSAFLPPSVYTDAEPEDDAESSFDDGGVDMSSPAQAYSRRQQGKTIRRCDGREDFRPLTGAVGASPKTAVVINQDSLSAKFMAAGLPGFGDNEAHGKILPCHRVTEDGLMRISSHTLDGLLDGKFDDKITDFHVIDCRFDYEYVGGHVPGPVNINTTQAVEELLVGPSLTKPRPSVSGDNTRKTVLVFHCEFSAKRAPTFAKHLRAKDRAMNNHVYPKIHYPEVYILEGGYCQYFKTSATRCQPPAYVTMDDPNHATSRRKDLHQFRKAKFGRHKSYAYGDSAKSPLAFFSLYSGPTPSVSSIHRFTQRPSKGALACCLPNLSMSYRDSDAAPDLGVEGDSEIRANMYKSLMLNTVSLASIYVFDLFLQPLVQGQQRWFHRNIGWFYQILWLLPVVGTSLYLNGTWCTVIAKRTFLLQHGGRLTAPQPTSYTGMLKAIATSAYRVVTVGTSVVISFVLQRVPVVGPYTGFLFLCWVDAYYCFEFVWIARGLSLSGRIRHLEERWAYYFAFGLPSALLCTVGTTLANAAIFALIFPVYIIMAMHARPVPSDPYNPSPSPPAGRTDPDVDAAIRHPSPFILIRLPIFAPVIVVNDGVVRVLNFIGGRPIVRPQQAGIGGGKASGVGRARAFSDAAESAEGGSGVGVQLEMKPLSSSASTATTTAGIRVPSARVKLGARRKVD